PPRPRPRRGGTPGTGAVARARPAPAVAASGAARPGGGLFEVSAERAGAPLPLGSRPGGRPDSLPPGRTDPGPEHQPAGVRLAPAQPPPPLPHRRGHAPQLGPVRGAPALPDAPWLLPGGRRAAVLPPRA